MKIYANISISKGDEEMRRKIVSMTMPLEVIEKIKAYQEKHFLPSVSSATVSLVMKALEKEEEK